VTVVGGILLLAGPFFLVLGRDWGADYRQLKNVPARRCSDLGVADVGRVCEIQGVTAAGAEGTVCGAYSGVEGVWAATEVKRRWDEYHLFESEGGGHKPMERNKSVLETERGLPFYVVDGSGRVAVLDVDRLQVRDFPATVRGTGETGRPEGYEPRGEPKPNERFVYEEWVLPAGVPIWVSGEVKRHGSGMAMGEPDGRGRVLLETAPAGETVGQVRFSARASYAVGGLGVLLGAVLIAAGLA
jgi:hypothetical protein